MRIINDKVILKVNNRSSRAGGKGKIVMTSMDMTNNKIPMLNFLKLSAVGICFFILLRSNQRNKLPILQLLGITALLLGLSIIAQIAWYSIHKEEKITIIRKKTENLFQSCQ